MGASKLVGEEIQRTVSKYVYIASAMFSVFILIVWVVLILNVSGVTAWPKPYTISSALVLFGMTATLGCAELWFMNRIGVLELADATEALISKLLIASILGTVATALGKAFL